MKTPWHLWVVGVLSLLWNAGGAYDWVMSHFAADSYLGMMSEDQRAWFDAFPIWAEVFWALGVWGAVVGSLLLLLRSGFAQLAFVLSLIGLLVNTAYRLTTTGDALSGGAGAGGLAFTAAIIIVALLLWLYARTMTRLRILR